MRVAANGRPRHPNAAAALGAPPLGRGGVSRDKGSSPSTPGSLSQSALRLLMDSSWPGNVRQLENAIEHAVAMSGGELEIAPDMLPGDIRHPDRAALVPAVTIPDEGINFTTVVSQLERELILRSLEKTGNKRQAARLRNMSRTTLIDKLQRLQTPC